MSYELYIVVDGEERYCGRYDNVQEVAQASFDYGAFFFINSVRVKEVYTR